MDLVAYQLETVNVIRKYIGLCDLLPSKLLASNERGDKLYTSFGLFGVNYEAMSKHKSQFVWFRHLFIFFSRYSYINTLKEVV
eukprot:gene16362-19465_t